MKKIGCQSVLFFAHYTSDTALHIWIKIEAGLIFQFVLDMSDMSCERSNILPCCIYLIQTVQTAPEKSDMSGSGRGLLFNLFKCPSESEKCPSEIKRFFIITEPSFVNLTNKLHLHFFCVCEIETKNHCIFSNTYT